MVNFNVPFDGITLENRQNTSIIVISFRFYRLPVTLPAEQWNRVGNGFQFLACRTISPANERKEEESTSRSVFALPSRTPKPKRWLNSKPAPLICHRCCFEGSNNWFRFAVRTVKCCTSRHVNCRLEWFGSAHRLLLPLHSFLLRFQSKSKYTRCFRGSCWCTWMFQCALSVKISRCHTRFRIVASTIAERRCQSGWAGFIVQSGATIVDRWIDGDGPHRCGITITITVIIRSSISTGPNIQRTLKKAKRFLHFFFDHRTYRDHGVPSWERREDEECGWTNGNRVLPHWYLWQ